MKQELGYRRENRAMPLQISVSLRMEVYCGIARFLCHSTAFLYMPTPATVQMLIFTAVTKNHGDSRKSQHTTDR